MKRIGQMSLLSGLAIFGVLSFNIASAKCITWKGRNWCEDATTNLARNEGEFLDYYYKYGCQLNLSCDLESFNEHLDDEVFGGYLLERNLLVMYTYPYTRYNHGCEYLDTNNQFESIDKCARVKFYQEGLEGGYGTYNWRVYLPKPEAKAQFSVGMFLYNDDNHELDFECGYGKNNSSGKKIMCYMTSQNNPYSAGDVKEVKSGWHTFQLKLEPQNDQYYAHWLIDGQEVKTLQLNYGDEKRFRLYFSTENLAFIGDEVPHKINWTAFKNVQYYPMNHDETSNNETRNSSTYVPMFRNHYKKLFKRK
ncbi:hypothetical protein [Nitratifractor sp.]|uniref:hypothetical protein n=1 Tax=Nitratifractor sp. TaxID=2268144 RepID=UPI0025FAF0AC|nr:hypothetical protein [Nitratifractor sp.]